MKVGTASEGAASETKTMQHFSANYVLNNKSKVFVWSEFCDVSALKV